jgi:hypothetical protein
MLPWLRYEIYAFISPTHLLVLFGVLIFHIYQFFMRMLFKVDFHCHSSQSVSFYLNVQCPLFEHPLIHQSFSSQRTSQAVKKATAVWKL